MRLTAELSPHPLRRRLIALLVSVAALAALLVSYLPTWANAAAGRSPVGVLEVASFTNGRATVGGWTIDPDVKTPIGVRIYIDGKPQLWRADKIRPDVAKAALGYGAAHGFSGTFGLANGSHQICAVGMNVGIGGTNTTLGCKTVLAQNNPVGAMTSVTRTPAGLRVAGWALDPNASAPVTVDVTVDAVHTRVVASATPKASLSAVPASYNAVYGVNHTFVLNLKAATGSHKVCLTAFNVGIGANSQIICRTYVVSPNPFGYLDTATRTSATTITVTGWVIDPDTVKATSVNILIDGKLTNNIPANTTRTDVAAVYPAYGPGHGYAKVISANGNPHTVCGSAVNVGVGAAVALACKSLPSTGDTVPAPVTGLQAGAASGSITLTWAAARSVTTPVTAYQITVKETGNIIKVSGSTLKAAITGLTNGKRYTFTIVGLNTMGTGSPATVTGVPVAIPPQTSPAPVSTSHYIRNITGNAVSDSALMRKMGAADAGYNPSGHRYLVLLQIGGQDQSRGGVLLSATSRYVSNAAVVTAMKAYLDGYVTKQKLNAPMLLAIGTNNDVDVSSVAGAMWARGVVNPVVSYAARYANIRVGGANDIEPGFSATAGETKSWLSGYVGATSAQFVFNGSADGCSTGAAASRCNNGWTMADLQWLSGGAAPTRSLSLPQIYNSAMPLQWKFISLTGVSARKPKLYFGGPLTEYTACQQAGSCGSITNVDAWNKLWAAISSATATRQADMPHGTDLRIN